jgi:ABC-2 type transport system ATP-binding protein
MPQADSPSKSFGPRMAVEQVSFDVRAGEIFALVGPNGAGKTTTLRMLAGLIRPSSGGVRFRGQPTAGIETTLRAGIGFLTEAPGLWDRLSVRQNLKVHARLHGLPQPDRAVDAAMDLFGVTDRAAEAAAVLSKGLRQRVALARALLHDPGAVLLDEPTSGLDPESARDVRELILRLRHERRAVLISTHNLDEVDRLADRVALLNTRLVALDTRNRCRRARSARVRGAFAGPADAHARTFATRGCRYQDRWRRCRSVSTAPRCRRGHRSPARRRRAAIGRSSPRALARAGLPALVEAAGRELVARHGVARQARPTCADGPASFRGSSPAIAILLPVFVAVWCRRSPASGWIRPIEGALGISPAAGRGRSVRGRHRALALPAVPRAAGALADGGGDIDCRLQRDRRSRRAAGALARPSHVRAALAKALGAFLRRWRSRWSATWWTRWRALLRAGVARRC